MKIPVLKVGQFIRVKADAVQVTVHRFDATGTPLRAPRTYSMPSLDAAKRLLNTVDLQGKDFAEMREGRQKWIFRQGELKPAGRKMAAQRYVAAESREGMHHELKYLVEQWERSGRVALYNAEKKTISLSGGKALPEKKAIKLLQDWLQQERDAVAYDLSTPEGLYGFPEYNKAKLVPKSNHEFELVLRTEGAFGNPPNELPFMVADVKKRFPGFIPYVKSIGTDLSHHNAVFLIVTRSMNIVNTQAPIVLDGTVIKQLILKSHSDPKISTKVKLADADTFFGS
jgi:hypothetical protein